MSTEDINKVVITLKKGVDVDKFMDEMASLGNTTPYVPNRAVELYNEKPDSLRNVDFVMTRAEADILKNDPRVEAVRYGSKKDNGIEKVKFTLDSQRLYTRVDKNTWAVGNVDMNWGVPQTNSRTNLYSPLVSQINYTWPYTLTGEGVDFVIQDSGLQVDHPEFTDQNNVSRVQQVNWFTLTGIAGTMPANFYTDADGHGTHVCSCAAGKTYGWAKNASIYVMNILGVNANSTIPSSLSFNMLRTWHENKSITSTGYKRPTIVNMSWGYTVPVSLVTGGNYRGTPWSGSGVNNTYGVINNGTGRMPYILASEEADVSDCLDAGVILVAAAGNSSYKIDVQGGLDYNNTVNYGGFGITGAYYMRGSSPNPDPRIIKVGAIAYQRDPEVKVWFSETGPGVGVYVAGESVVGACSTTNDYGSDVRNYPFNSAYKSVKIAGTSMASPQVAGLICCLLQSRPWYDTERIKNWVFDNASVDRLTDTAGGYTDFNSLQGGPNRYLYNPWAATNPTVIEHTAPAKVDENPDYTAAIHGKL